MNTCALTVVLSLFSLDKKASRVFIQCSVFKGFYYNWQHI